MGSFICSVDINAALNIDNSLVTSALIYLIQPDKNVIFMTASCQFAWLLLLVINNKKGK